MEKEMKHAGYMLACPDSYLDNFPEYCINLSWKCREFGQLRVDADGSLFLCPDLREDMGRFNSIGRKSPCESVEMRADKY